MFVSTDPRNPNLKTFKLTGTVTNAGSAMYQIDPSNPASAGMQRAVIYQLPPGGTPVELVSVPFGNLPVGQSVHIETTM